MIWLNLWAIVHLFSNKPSQNPAKEFLLASSLLKESCGKKEHQVNTNRCLLFILKIDHSLSAYARYLAVPLISGRLNYKLVTKPYVVSDHFNLH